MGYLLNRNESVTITCQILTARKSSNFTWSKITFSNHSELDGNNIGSWQEGEYLYSSITLENFDYSHCGVYVCQVNSNGTQQSAKMPLSINGMMSCILFGSSSDILFFWTAENDTLIFYFKFQRPLLWNMQSRTSIQEYAMVL